MITNNNFPLSKKNSCGESAVKSILSMYNKNTNISISNKDGTSPVMITKTLNNKGIQTEIKDNISYESLKPKSIIYYPKEVHWITTEKITPDNIFINDSDFSKGKWIDKKDFIKKWKGYAIETKLNNHPELGKRWA